MAGQTLDTLPPAIALNGGELMWLYQQGPTEVTPWVGVRATTGQIAALASEGIVGPVGSICSMRQLLAAMAFEGVMVLAFNSLPADITNSYNIAWSHAYKMTITDPFVTGFLQPAIGYNNEQMIALFILALTFPV